MRHQLKFAVVIGPILRPGLEQAATFRKAVLGRQARWRKSAIFRASKTASAT